LTTPPRRSAPDDRAGKRRRRAAPPPRSFLDRNRTRLIYGALGVVVAIVAALAFLNFSQPAYACSNVFEPTPEPASSAAPASPGTSPAASRLGFVQADMGHTHVDPGTRVKYLYCPPASGKHYPEPGGPISAGVYAPGDIQIPQGWIHNLEHGGLVLLYKCPGDACTDQGQQALRTLYQGFPASPICAVPAGGNSGTPVFARFDDMPWPYAVVVWDVVLPLQTLVSDQVLEFWATQGERFNPEPQCAPPSPTPGPTGTPAPTPTTAPTTAPGASPAASPATSGSTGPVESPAPSAS
jgi:hypothetical protein